MASNKRKSSSSSKKVHDNGKKANDGKKTTKKARIEKANDQPEASTSSDESPRSIVNPKFSLKYPAHLTVDFKQLKSSTLRKYAQAYNLKVRPDLPQSELAILVARHFDAHLDVDEYDSIYAFCKRVRTAEDWKEFGFDIQALKKGTRESTKRKKKSSRRRQEQEEEDEEPEQEKKASQPPVYCICREGDYGQMIACDNKQCRTPNEWYHLPCIGLEVVPKDKWYCPTCVSDKDGGREEGDKKKKKSTSPQKKK